MVQTQGSDLKEQEFETPVQTHEEAPKPKHGLNSFVFMEETVKVLNVAMATSENLILFGKGGYGKSEVSIEYLKANKIQPYVMTMGTGTTTEKLFGGFDINTFNQTGKMEYLVENSFMNHEYVIFEELFDAPDFILEQLKDILSSGVFRNGSQYFPIKTQLIICCTNKTREEFAKNNSLKALMERFPLEFEVKWNSHTKEDYSKLLLKKLGSADPLLTHILEAYGKANQPISPRIAITAAEVLTACGLDCLRFIADFASKPEILTDALKAFEASIKFTKLKEKIALDLKIVDNAEHMDPAKTTLAEVGEVKKALSRLELAIVELDTLELDESNIEDKINLQDDMKHSMVEAKAILELF
jgi:MoxR-like ATPase